MASGGEIAICEDLPGNCKNVTRVCYRRRTRPAVDGQPANGARAVRDDGLAFAGRYRAIPFEKSRMGGFVDVRRMLLRARGMFSEHRARTDGPGLEITAAIRTHVAKRA